MNHDRPGISPFRMWRKRLAYGILPVLTLLNYLLIKGISLTMRTRFSGEAPVRKMLESNRPFVMAFFHGRQFLLVHQIRKWPNTVMLNISYLGEIMARTLRMFGYVVVRGSSKRSANRVLAELIRNVRGGRIAIFAVDGPRGPYREFKPGAVFAAKKLGVPLVPVTTAAWPGLTLTKLWDRFLIPLPFSRGLVLFGEPVLLDGDLSKESIDKDCKRMGRILVELEEEADVLVSRINR